MFLIFVRPPIGLKVARQTSIKNAQLTGGVVCDIFGQSFAATRVCTLKQKQNKIIRKTLA